MIELLPRRTQVKIIKPDDVKIKGRGVVWYPEMDRFIGTIALVSSSYKDYIVLICPDSNNNIHLYDWHPDWVKVISKDKDGNPEPYDNQGRGSCHWCDTPTKTIRLAFENKRKIILYYCPRCKR